MPLSEYEQRVLAEMEQHLREADPELATSMQVDSPGFQIDVRRLSIGILLGLIGIAVLVAGVATNLAWIGVIGFGVMLAGVLVAMNIGSSGGSRKDKALPPDPKPTPKPASSFMQRQQERWERREE